VTSLRGELVGRRAGGSRAGALDRARELTERRAWILVGVVAAGSALVRFSAALESPGPWIFPDELIYSELARSLAESGSLTVRDGFAWGTHNVVYPLLLAPAYLLFDSPPDAYAATKAVNAALMSAAALPAYALARRLVSPPAAVVCALLSLLVPSLAYTATVMTENAFYPIFLLAALALVRHLERPSAGRALVVAGALALAALTRTQGLVLVPAVLTAAAIVDAMTGEARWRRTPPLAALTAAGALAAAAAGLARDGSPLALLGPYRAALELPSPLSTLDWLAATLADLDLYTGVLPFAAWLALVFSLRRSEPRERIFLVASAALVGWLAVQVAVFSAWTTEERIMDRYAFYAVPFFFAALLAWLERPQRAGLRETVAAGATAAALLVFLPLDLVGRTGSSDTLGLLPLWTVRDRIGSGALPLLVAAGALAAAILLVAGRRGGRTLAVGAVTAYLAAAALQVDHHFAWVSSIARHEGVGTGTADWVDRALPPGEDATVLVADTRFASYPLWEHEFFNARLGAVHRLAGEYPGDLPTQLVYSDPRTGLVRRGDGRPLANRYVLAESSVRLAAQPVAREAETGATLYRVRGPVRWTSTLHGRYFDGWTGPEFAWTRSRCAGGHLLLDLRTSQALFPEGQTLTARVGRRTQRFSVSPITATQLALPIEPQAGRCEAQFVVEPARALARHFASSDWRVLGVLLEDLRYVPSRRENTTGAAATSTAKAKK
jgi:hypothetical protein